MAKSDSSTFDPQHDHLSDALLFVQRAGAITDLLYTSSVFGRHEELSQSTVSNSLDILLTTISEAESALNKLLNIESKEVA